MKLTNHRTFSPKSKESKINTFSNEFTFLRIASENKNTNHKTYSSSRNKSLNADIYFKQNKSSRLTLEKAEYCKKHRPMCYLPFLEDAKNNESLRKKYKMSKLSKAKKIFLEDKFIITESVGVPPDGTFVEEGIYFLFYL